MLRGEPMGARRFISSLALVTLVVVTGLSVGAWAVIRNGVQRQNSALVQNGAAQVALVAQTTLQSIQTELRSVAFFTSSSGYSPTVFEQQARAELANPRTSVALVNISASTPEVMVAQGPDLHPGALDPVLAAVADSASASLTSTIVQLGTTRDLVFAASSAVVPSLVTLATTPLPTESMALQASPYRSFAINVFNGTKARSASLLITTDGHDRLPTPVASSVVTFADVTWLIHVSARTPLAGSYASASPWVALGVGLLVAASLAASVEILARRNRHSARMVELRTAELLDAHRAMVRQERLAAVGEMATVIGHELRNPLGAAINNLYLTRAALGEQPHEEVDTHLLRAERQVNRAARLSEDLTAYMREREPAFAEVEFAELVSRVLESTPAPADVTVLVDSTATVRVDPSLMTQVLTNLVTNAYEAMPEGGSVHLAASTDPGPLITVEDTGGGFDPGVATRLFDPFFTTRQEGTGLGLAVVNRLVEAQGGTVSIENVSSGGVKVTISFAGGAVDDER